MHQPLRFWDSAHPDYVCLLHRDVHAVEILEQAHMVNCNPSRTPVDTESTLGEDGDPVCRYKHDPRYPYLLAVKRVLRTEAKYRGVANAITETYWLWNLLRELDTSLSSATLVL
nr:ribonuclease H-like domain-containing protein [Tanacetum cinerariifolium]